MDPTEPTPDDSIAAYIVNGIDRQDAETLDAIEQYARERREYEEAKEAAEIEDDEVKEEVDDEEEIVDTEDTDGGTVVIKKVPCGKNCDGCPHGPYKYVVTREGDSLNWEYIGPVDA